MPEIVRSTVAVPGRPGTYVLNSRLGERVIEVDLVYVGSSIKDASERRHMIAEWLFSPIPRPLVFDDEPGRIYYAQVDGDTNIENISLIRKFTIRFVCSDPFVYSDTETTVDVSNGENVIENGGSIEVYPRYDLTLGAASSFVSVSGKTASGDDVHVTIGEPAADYTPTYTARTAVLIDPLSVMDWTHVSGIAEPHKIASNVMAPDVDSGTYRIMGTSGTAFSPLSGDGDFGDPPDSPYVDGWYGPTVYKNLPGDPLEYFEVWAFCGMNNASDARTMGRIELYGLTASNKVIFRIGIADTWTAVKQTRFRAQVGSLVDGYHILHNNVGNSPNWWTPTSSTQVQVTIQRASASGQPVWNARIRRRRSDGSYDQELTVSWVEDISVNQYLDDGLDKIALHIGAYGGPTSNALIPSSIYCSHLEVWALPSDAQEGALALFEAGDMVTVDMATGAVLLNGGEDSRVTDQATGRILPLSAFVHRSSMFFPLMPGNNSVIVTADTGVTVTGSAVFTERWL